MIGNTLNLTRGAIFIARVHHSCIRKIINVKVQNTGRKLNTYIYTYNTDNALHICYIFILFLIQSKMYVILFF